MTILNPAAADNVQYSTDPRIRHLAEATWRMRTGGSRWDWICLGKDNPEALIAEAREWVRAAVAAGILPPPENTSEWKTAARLAAEADEIDACGKCRRAFDPTDTRHDGHARHNSTPWCRRCIDRCYESTDAFHQCAICR